MYREMLSRAWAVAKSRPWLWVLGLFGALLGNGGEYQLLVRAFDYLAAPSRTWWWPAALAPAGGTVDGGGLTLLIMALAVVALGLWLATSSIAGLFAAGDALIYGRTATLREAWRAGLRHFGKTFGLLVIGKGLTVLLLMVAIAPVVLVTAAGSTDVTLWLTSLVSFVVFVPLSVIISFATKYGIAYAVLEDQTFAHALTNGWKLFWRNWLVSIEMALLLFAISVAVSIFLVILSLIVLVLVLALNTAVGTVGVPVLIGPEGFVILRFIVGLLVLPVVLLAGALLTVFQTLSWIMVFRQLHHRGVTPKLLRLFRRPASAAVPPAPRRRQRPLVT